MAAAKTSAKKLSLMDSATSLKSSKMLSGSANRSSALVSDGDLLRLAQQRHQQQQPLTSIKAAIYADLFKEAIQKLQLIKSLNVAREKEAELSDKVMSVRVEKSKSVKGGAGGGGEKPSGEQFLHELETILRECQLELEAKGTFSTLTSYVHENQQKQGELNALKKSQHSCLRKLEKSKRELQMQETQYEKDLEQIADKLEMMKQSLSELKQLCNVKQKYIKRQNLASETAFFELCKSEESQLQKEIDKAKHLLAHEVSAHKHAMDFLQWQREQVESEVERMMAKYEHDLEAKTAELDQLKQRKTETNGKYEDLQMEFENITRMVEEEKAARQRAKEERLHKREQIRSAKKIQRWYRQERVNKKAKKAAKSAKKGKK